MVLYYIQIFVIKLKVSKKSLKIMDRFINSEGQAAILLISLLKSILIIRTKHKLYDPLILVTLFKNEIGIL